MSVLFLVLAEKSKNLSCSSWYFKEISPKGDIERELKRERGFAGAAIAVKARNFSHLDRLLKEPASDGNGFSSPVCRISCDEPRFTYARRGSFFSEDLRDQPRLRHGSGLGERRRTSPLEIGHDGPSQGSRGQRRKSEADRPLPRLRRRSGMIFLAKGRLVTLTEGVVRDTASFATSPESSREAGGILLGHHRGPHVEILKCTIPMPGDRRTRFGFVRHDKGHQETATREWRESGGAINFVGEWHTHPERHPTPSWIDRRSWRRQMIRAERDPLVFIIVGSAAVYCEIGVEGQLATMGRVSQ
jgi:integrative and conjugative element protein (TIGR02256 family)